MLIMQNNQQLSTVSRMLSLGRLASTLGLTCLWYVVGPYDLMCLRLYLGAVLAWLVRFALAACLLDGLASLVSDLREHHKRHRHG